MHLILLSGNSPDNKSWIEEVAAALKELKTLLEQAGVQNHKIEEIPGTDHHYGDVQLLRELVLDFITAHQAAF